MAKKRKNKRQQHGEPEDILAGRVAVTALELIRMIHRINPTKENRGKIETRERYRIKARLQSLLINEFKDSLRVLPDPSDPGLVSLQLKHFDENACHALVSELDDGAISWVKMAVDLGSGGQDPSSLSLGREVSPLPGTGKANKPLEQEELSPDELLDLGAKALEAYDYDACEDLLFRAFSASKGAPPAARALMEFLVDYLAAHERAVSLGNSLSKKSRKDPLVSAKLALALARSNRVEEALALLGRSREASAMEVYFLGAEYFISQNDPDRAEQLWKILASSQDHPFVSQMAVLVEKMDRLRTDRLKPMEQEMLDLWHRGRHDGAGTLAQKILDQAPTHRAARKIHRAFFRMRREQEVLGLLEQAELARAETDFSREVVLLKKALDMDGDGTGLNIKEMLETAAGQAQKLREQEVVRGVVTLWQEGERKEPLITYLSLSRDQQQQCRTLLRDEHLLWTDQLMAAVPNIKPEKAAESVLALGKVQRMMAEHQDPLYLLGVLNGLETLVGEIPSGRTLMARINKEVHERETQSSKRALKQALLLLGENQPDQVRDCIKAINNGCLCSRDQEMLADITSRLMELERIQALERTHAVSADRKDHFTARETAKELAHLLPQGKGESWLKKADEQTALIKGAWSLVCAREAGLGPSFWNAGIYWRNDIHCCAVLMEESRQMVMMSCLERRLFVRTFDLETRKFDLAVMISPPVRMNVPILSLEGDRIWITGGQGGVVCMTLNPLDILSWKDCSSHIKDDLVLENVWFFPGHNNLWLHLRPLDHGPREVASVISLAQQREVRSVRIDGVPWTINQNGELYLGDSSLESDTIKIYSGSGHQQAVLEKKTPGYVEKGVMHPDGTHLIFLVHDPEGDLFSQDESDDTACCLHMEVLPNDAGRSVARVIPDSNGEMNCGIATSMGNGLVFVYYYETLDDGDRLCLSAFKPDPDGFEELYKVAVPKNFIFVTDQASLNVVGVAPGKNGIQSVLLDQEVPKFDLADHPDQLQDNDIPMVDKYQPCKIPTGVSYDLSMDYKRLLPRNTLKEIHGMFRNIKKKGDREPDDLFAFHCALGEERIYSDLSKEVLQWIRDIFPDHPRTLMIRADQALKRLDWQSMVALLKGVEIQGVDHGTAGHICHLLGMGLFCTGEVKEAVKVWRRGKRLKDSKCEFDDLIAYGRFAAMSDKAREKARKNGGYPKSLDLIETLDDSLEQEQWVDAIAAAKHYEINSIRNPQILARLAEAMMHQTHGVGEKGWFEKVIILDTFSRESHPSQVSWLALPPHMITWSEERIRNLKDRAALWVKD